MNNTIEVIRQTISFLEGYIEYLREEKESVKFDILFMKRIKLSGKIIQLLERKLAFHNLMEILIEDTKKMLEEEHKEKLELIDRCWEYFHTRGNNE